MTIFGSVYYKDDTAEYCSQHLILQLTNLMHSRCHQAKNSFPKISQVLSRGECQAGYASAAPHEAVDMDISAVWIVFWERTHCAQIISGRQVLIWAVSATGNWMLSRHLTAAVDLKSDIFNAAAWAWYMWEIISGSDRCRRPLYHITCQSPSVVASSSRRLSFTF